MEKPNDRQIGGDHYKGVSYELWDFVTDAGIAYVPGNAIKYIFRHKKKGGKQDLEKALHYIDKAIERQVPAPQQSEALNATKSRFCSTVPDLPARLAIYAMAEGKYSQARGYVEECLEFFDEQAGALPDLSANLSD